MSDRKAARKDRVYLTGFMGSGKSTLGPILANSIGYAFVDLDKAIEERERMSVREIFRVKGEHHFREREKKELQHVSTAPRTVIALGGGTLVDPENNRIVASTGLLVYLKLSREEVFQRLRHRSDRPMLADLDGDPLPEPLLRERIERLYREREPLYAAADVTILTDETRVGVTVDRLVRLLRSVLDE
jgi:shikimate kinase